MTYSIVALDPASGELGVAVQSRWFCVGNGVTWVEPGVGAVATQSFTEVGHGPNGLRLMREGRPAPAALAEVLAADPGEAVRQVGMVDARGRAASHTGSGCVRFASHLVGDGVAVQANMMERSTVPAAMLAAFTSTDGDLAARLLAALVAAEGEGGDVRGRQSAALLVAPGSAAAGDDAPAPWTRRFDVRVDDHRAPLDELGRLLTLARAYDAMDEAEAAGARRDIAAAAAASERSITLAPNDDQIRLWHAVGLVLGGRIDDARVELARATTVEPRSGEHLRRFAEQGHLPGGDATLGALGLA